MKKSLVLLVCVSLLGGLWGRVCAQQGVHHFDNGDYVTISVTEMNNDVLYRYYMEASTGGLGLSDMATDACLWQVCVPEGADTAEIMLKDVSTGYYLQVELSDANDPWNSAHMTMTKNDNVASRFRFYAEVDGTTNDPWSKGKYRYGKLYHKKTCQFSYGSMDLNFYLGLNWINNQRTFDVKTWIQSSIYIEKWEQKGEPTGYFEPSKIEFNYDKEHDSAGEHVGAAQEVHFHLNAETNSYWECVNRPDELKLMRELGDIDFGTIQPTIYWTSSKTNVSKVNPSAFVGSPAAREVMEIDNPVVGDGVFTIRTMGDLVKDLKVNAYGGEQWIDYADNVVAEFTYGGKTYTTEMRVVRKSYHTEQLPTLTFSINPVTYTFGLQAETKPFSINVSHQHGEVIYNMDHQAIKTSYTEGPDKINLNDSNWELAWGGGCDWLKIGSPTENNVAFSVAANSDKVRRSCVLTGTFRKKSGGDLHSGTFEIPLYQRGIEGGIKFKTQAGKGASDKDKEEFKNTSRQNVHTAERTIYYEANQEIELRLPESGFSGYMRWYDYETNGDPYYNYCHEGKASTSWVLSPRAASGQPFSAINTPQNANTIETEGYSYGLYAVNKANNGVLDEDNPSNPAPILRGWTDGKEHTMACDVSAYTDYTIWYNRTNATRVDSIQEPTLSYRQLFHLKPATEMAEKFANLGEGEYLEEYNYMAPAGRQVLLSTEFRYKKYRSHESEMCYFYYGTDGKVHRITANTPVVWKEDGNVITPNYTSEMDYLIVRSNTPTNPNKKVYTLTLPAGAANNAKELRIAKFEVEYQSVNATGPTTTTLISQQRINTSYKSLVNINFDNQTTHLPWGESSYGYVYSNLEGKRRAEQGVFPFYGEYMEVESVNKEWAEGTAHGGSGKALYVDGTMEPGLVASIYTDAVICSGQTIICSAWFCNPTPNDWAYGEGNPIFRCNIQGRNDDDEEWHDVSVYFVGELLKQTGWHQVVFPIVSEENYAQTRVSIYNFATTNMGNDFMVDDICLFVSPLPLAAYHGEMACRSTGESDTRAAAVLRLDYSNLDANVSEYVYYQIYNDTQGDDVDLTGDVAYYHDKAHDHEGVHKDNHYGSIRIPSANYKPTGNDVVYQSVSKMLDEMVAAGKMNQKAYVRTLNSGVEKYLLYVAHLVENTESNADCLTKLFVKDDYSMRMAFAVDELGVPSCNMQTPLHATQRTEFDLRKSDGTMLIPYINTTNVEGGKSGCCPNMQYTLDAKIINHFAEDLGGVPQDYEAKVYADWLVGSVFDAPYTQGRPASDSDIKKEIDAKYQAKYGYTRGQIASAIMYDMRRVPTEDLPNDNYAAKSFKELNVNHFLSRQNYDIIQHLCEKGFLDMYKTNESFYLSNADTIRYWVFPIAETAKTVINSQSVTLKDCVEPRWVEIVSKDISGYFLNIAPLKRSAMTEEQRAMLPTYKVLKKNVDMEITLPVTEVGNTINVAGKTITSAGEKISLTLPAIAGQQNGVEIVDLESGQKIARSALKAGKEYHVHVTFTDAAGGNMGGECGGTVTFILAVVPDVLVWTPAASSYNGWGKDENWLGWVDDGDGVMEAGEMVNGYVPMSGADVIIPTQDNVLRYPHIIDEHAHYPMVINYEAHHCENIYFAPNAHFQNQHLLEYEKAYVDMLIPATRWNLLSAPLKDMYTGDIFVPHTGKYDDGGYSVESNKPFEVKGFAGTRAWDAAYAFWSSFYNQDVYVHNQSGHYQQTTTTAEFVPSNSLVQEIVPGSGVSVLGYGPGDKEEDLLVRLPKKDTKYYTYNQAGNPSKEIAVPSRENSHELAFDVKNGGMTITLEHKIASNHFVFGNPTMSNINMQTFINDNKAVGLTGAYYSLQGDSWESQIVATSGRYLAPMRAVLLETSSSKTSITVTLKPTHTTLDNQVVRSSLPAKVVERRGAAVEDEVVQEEDMTEMMTIYGMVEDAYARIALVVNEGADNAYYKSEDALFISSGVEAGTEGDMPVVSLVNMYTVANNVPMMTDVRSEISQVPLSVLVDEEYRSDKMRLVFKLSPNWKKICHFCDAETGQKIRIYDELSIWIEMPDNHEERYYIEGPDPYNSGGGVTTSTTHPIEEDGANGAQLYVYPEGNGKVLVTSDGLIQSVTAYDMLGRVVASKEQQLLSHEVRLNVPVGVCVVEAVMQNGMRQRERVIVK